MQIRPTVWTLAGVFFLVAMGGLLYGYLLSIPAALAVPIAAAFAVEGCLYVAAMLPSIRELFEAHLPPRSRAVVMAASGGVPYLLYAPVTGTFNSAFLLLLVGMAVAISFWFVAFRRRRLTDFAFVAFFTTVFLAPLFSAIYGQPWPKVPLSILGLLMWSRLGILSAISIGHIEVKGFGLIPKLHEWRAGFVNFLWFLPPGIALGWALDFSTFRIRPAPFWQTALIALGTFLGMFWVVALREEFFARGLLQQWFEDWFQNRWLGLAMASLLFGVIHLPFRDFPNWRFATLAAVAGLFYGRAYMTARSVRAAMVTHALVNTVWRVFFS